MILLWLFYLVNVAAGQNIRCGLGLYRSPRGTCRICPQGSYSDDAYATECKPCPGGLNSKYGAGSISDCKCGRGYYSTNEHGRDRESRGCTPCPIGKYNQLVTRESCTACPAGKTTLRKGAGRYYDCIARCDPGYYWRPGQFLGWRLIRERCVICPIGTYNAAEYADQCTQCPQGQTTSQEGATSAAQCQPLCDPGYFWNIESQKCEECPIGEYSETNTGTSCTKCGSNQTTENIGSNSISLCVCNTGHYCQLELDDKICIPCARGTFKSEIGDLECSECPTGATTLTVGSDQCVCNTGHYYQQDLDKKICLPCAIGTFKSEIGDFECSECPANASTLTMGADQCVCDGGYYHSIHSASCLICPQGTYKSGTNESCLQCPYQLTTSSAGATAISACLFCDRGYYDFRRSCVSCDLGTYQPDIGRIRSCEECCCGRSWHKRGATSRSQCNVCSPGYYSLYENILRCRKCPIGTYKHKPGKQKCTICPYGQTTLEVGSNHISKCGWFRR